MAQPKAEAAPFARFSISEDWLATIIGLVIVVIIALLVTGPAPQTVTITAPAGETAAAAAAPQGGFAVSAKLEGATIPVNDAVRTLEAGSPVVYLCENNELTVQESAELPEGVEAADEGRAQVVVINNCEGEVVLTYKTSNVIPWPVFRLFGR